MSLDDRFFEQMQPWDQTMKEKREEFFKGRKELKDPLKEETELNEQPKLKKAAASLNKKFPLFFFSDPDQLISEKTAFIMTTLLRGVIREPQGTGGAAREIKWPIAGKTGTTNGYYDAWFIGYSSQIAVGVWLGFDDEKTLGRGETGAKAALPIWLNFMKSAHEEKEKEDFLVPEGIVFTNIDNETGQLVSTQSKQIIRQAFIEGTQPQEGEEFNEEEDQDFLREDFSQ
ncbi:MAG: hypothetical protein F4X95_02485 [Oligoflexia bacterium]|nr:hypothetical protein [Oligoflexia bacterium]